MRVQALHKLLGLSVLLEVRYTECRSGKSGEFLAYSLTDKDWQSSAETVSNESGHMQDTLDATLSYSYNVFEPANPSIYATLRSGEGNEEGTHVFPRPLLLRRLRLLTSRRSGSTSKALILCVSLVVLGVLLLYEAKAERVSKELTEEAAAQKAPKEIGAEEARAKLEKVRELLPAAERLATVVGTTEAASLYKKVKKNVSLGTEEEGAKDDARRLQLALTSALDSLRRLQEAACEEAEAIVQNMPVPHVAALQGLWGHAVISGFNQSDKMSIEPFLASVTSFVDSQKWFSRFTDTLHRQIKNQKQFENENDKDTLKFSAADLLRLRTAQSDWQRAVHITGELDELSCYALKSLTRRKWMFLHMQFEGIPVFLQLLSDFVREASEKAGEDSVAEYADVIDKMNKVVKEAKHLTSELLTHMREVEESITSMGFRNAYEKAKKAEKKLDSSLPKWQDLIDGLTFPQNLTPDNKQQLKQFLLDFYGKAVNESGLIQGMLKDAENSRNLVFANNTSEVYVNSTMLDRQLQDFKAHSRNVVSWTFDMYNVIRALDQASSVSSGLTAAKTVSVIAGKIFKARESATWLSMEFNLLQFLQEDMAHSAAVFAAVDLNTLKLSANEVNTVHWLKTQFEETLRDVKEAVTLKDIAAAASGMRLLSQTLLGVVFTSVKT